MKFINLTMTLSFLAFSTFGTSQGVRGHRYEPVTEEVRARYAALDAARHLGEKNLEKARKLLDAGDPRADDAFDAAAQAYASMPDLSSEAEVQAEWSFECGDYPEVVRLSAKINQIEGHRPALLRLAISECRTGHPEMALPRLAQWRAMEYCGSGEMPEIDLPVEAALDARSVQATAWLLLSFNREQTGRPALGGLLEAQRLAPRNPLVAYRLVSVGIVSGDLALARRNLPLLGGAKSADIRGRRTGVAATLDRLERTAEPIKKAG